VRKIAFIALLVGSFFIFSCASSDPRSLENYGPKKLELGPPSLALSALLVEFVPDLYNSTYLYADLARAYASAGYENLAQEILRRALQKIQAGKNDYALDELRLYLAGVFLELSYDVQGAGLIQQVYNSVLLYSSDLQKGSALGEIIKLGFRFPNELTDLMQEAIDNVYILDDPTQKVDLLVDLGRKYQDINSGGSISSLLQHAIITAYGISDPLKATLAFEKIARVWETEGAGAEALKWLNQATSYLGAVDFSQIQGENNTQVQEVLLNLTHFSRFTEVNQILALLPDIDVRLSIQYAVIDAYLQQGSSGAFQARLAVQRLLNQLSSPDQLTSTLGAERAAAALVRIAESYFAAGYKTETLQYADSAGTFIDNNAFVGKNDLRSRLTVLYARTGESLRASVQLNLIDDSYTIARTGITILSAPSILGSENKGNFALGPSLFNISLSNVQSSTVMKETLLSGLINVSGEWGYFPSAEKLLLDLNDPYTLASTVLKVWPYLETARNSDASTTIQELSKRWLARNPLDYRK